jgi:hypothetical protein
LFMVRQDLGWVLKDKNKKNLKAQGNSGQEVRINLSESSWHTGEKDTQSLAGEGAGKEGSSVCYWGLSHNNL